MHAGAWWDTAPQGLMISTTASWWYTKPTGTPKARTLASGNPYCGLDKQKRNFCLPKVPFLLAEREGFEPSVRDYRTHDFQSCALDQLSHLSVSTHIWYHNLFRLSSVFFTFFKFFQKNCHFQKSCHGWWQFCSSFFIRALTRSYQSSPRKTKRAYRMACPLYKSSFWQTMFFQLSLFLR